jgi:hypothetical protein
MTTHLNELRLLLEPLTAIVQAHPSLAFVSGLVLAAFIGYAIAAVSHSALTGLMAFAGLYWQVAVVLALAVTVWLVHARIYPVFTCRRCRGAGGFQRRFLGKTTSRPCRCCHGTGTHLRLGRRLLNPILGAHR